MDPGGSEFCARFSNQRAVDVSQVAAGWYPDPEVVGQLRWWDGNAWSEHVAPAQPASTDVAATAATPEAAGSEATTAAAAGTATGAATEQVQQYAQEQYPQQAAPVAGPPMAPIPQPRPKKDPASRVWSAGTWVTLGVCLALILGAFVVVPQVYANANAVSDREAEQVLNKFIAAGENQDDSWRDYATPQFSARVLAGAPIGGERNTAEALKLKVTTEVGELTLFANEWYSSNPPRSDQVDMGTADITITYNFTLDGKEQQAVVEQTVWMARPFYYGDKKPSMFDSTEKPTAVGPWRVFRLANRANNGTPPKWTTTLSEKKIPSIKMACDTGPSAFQDMSDSLRVDNKFYSNCLFGNAGVLMPEDLNREDVAAHIPAIDPIGGRGNAAEITGVGNLYLGGKNTPIMEFPFKGEKGMYVATFVLIKEEEYGIASTDNTRAAFVAIQPAAVVKGDSKPGADEEKSK